MEQRARDHSGGVAGQAPWETEYQEYWEDRFHMTWDQLKAYYAQHGGPPPMDQPQVSIDPDRHPSYDATEQRVYTHREERDIYNRQWQEDKEVRHAHNMMLYDGYKSVR